jgi:hypothetical protein
VPAEHHGAVAGVRVRVAQAEDGVVAPPHAASGGAG